MRKVRRWVDENYPGRVLLAEANQWPADVVDYFGGKRDPDTGEWLSAGDECHMCFHFPVMPRIFMAVRRENRFPISEILEQTPAIPDGCQWGIFLRNHDELTLEMVTDEDRDYMWDEYAKDPRMKANIGIRRRLAPLLDNDTNRMELFTALLLSLPGSPVLYYGDEIGMGDNIWLGDRDGVRTPMQWTPDRNAGFSIATPGKLHLPPIQDPVFGYQRVNVETELDNSSSLLHWTRRMIQARKQHPCFGLGEFIDLGGSNPSVLSYVREFVDDDGHTDTVLCVNNLSRFPQPVELDLRRWEGVRPVELLGGVRFPQIGELPYLLTLGGYGFYWIRLPRVPGGGGAPMSEHPQMTAYLAEARWFAGKGREYDVVDVHRVGTLPGPPAVTIDIITVRVRPRKVAAKPRPSATRCRSRTTPRSRTGSTTPTSARTSTRPGRRAHLRRRARPRGDGRLPRRLRAAPRRSSPSPTAGVTFHRRRRLRPRHRRRTRRCSAASRATPRSPSARTA